MKIRLIALLLVTLTLLSLSACGNTPGTENTEPSTQPTDSGALTENDTEVTTAENTIPTTENVPETIKILAIGNSFSTDCMEYLYQLLKDAGVKKIVLGNLYYGGCKLEQHLKFAKGDTTDYTYYKNTTGSWASTKNYKMSRALKDEDWDVVTLQESSKTCGIASAYQASLAPLVDIVEGQLEANNCDATLVWNMTWAYQQDSTHSSFPKYDKNQMTMYRMLVDCTKNYVEKDGRFSYVIPVGTSVQDARTSYLGDHLTRDGYHLNKQFGRYLAALTWACKILNIGPDKINYNPCPADINADMIRVAKESVRNAMQTPYTVTESQIKTGEGSLAAGGTTTVDPNEVLNPEDFYEADKAVAAANGVNLDNYELLRWEYVENAYWACTSRTNYSSPAAGAGTYHQNVCTNKMFSVETELPIGSVFICDSGWQYRLEIHPSQTEVYTGTRPSLSTKSFFTLTDSFLHGCKYVAWNIASSPKSDISAIYAQAAVHLRIYVPKK